MNKKLRILIPTMLGLYLVLGLISFLSPELATAQSPNPPFDVWTWKAGGYWDYAPSGVPDFDQKQDNWTFPDPTGYPRWSFCGPVAAANSLWWFDSKFETNPLTPTISGPYNDNYHLVSTYANFYPPYDDHDPYNVGGMENPPGTYIPGLIERLACYFKTNVFGSGTEVHNMSVGLQQYLYADMTHQCYGVPTMPYHGSYYDEYHVQLVKSPTWEWVAEEVERSEDVILLIGFWNDNGGEYWERAGGHFVTVAGVFDSQISQPQIAFSDPYYDNAELTGIGRVLTGTLIPHTPIPLHTSEVHNDAGNVSHDAYGILNMSLVPPPTNLPTYPGLWAINGYPPILDPNFVGQNSPSEFAFYEGGGQLVSYAVVEYAIAMSPFYWKAGGEFVDTYYSGEWYDEWWWYLDDADSCLPDFGIEEAYLDGPVALANSLWWFDSKVETLLTGGFPVPPPAVSDHYNLVVNYSPDIKDDHDPANTPLFINLLEVNLGTTAQGTTKEDMETGIKTYLSEPGHENDFYYQAVDYPTWEWIADEVRVSEDVIILLGFYEKIDDYTYERKGGHWVNAAGVNRNSKLIGLSDPYIDNANNHSIGEDLYLGRVYPPEQLGIPFTPSEKQEPQSISHDIYEVVSSPLVTTSLALDDFPAESFFDVYMGMNGGGEDWEPKDPISTVVEWAIGVSPFSDLVITKTVPISIVTPGEPITYTIEYANTGFAAVENVIISDTVPSLLTGVSFDSYPPITALPGYTYTWQIDKLSYGQTGTITITGNTPFGSAPYNMVYITGTNTLENPTPDRDLSNNWDDAGWKYAIYLPIIMR